MTRRSKNSIVLKHWNLFFVYPKLHAIPEKTKSMQIRRFKAIRELWPDSERTRNQLGVLIFTQFYCKPFKESIEYNHLAETVEIQKSQIHRLELELEIKSDKIFETGKWNASAYIIFTNQFSLEKELESSFALIAELRSKLNYKEKE